MPNISFGGAIGTASLRWTALKARCQQKSLRVQYDDDGVVYTVFAIEEGIVYTTTIWKGTVPDSIAVSYSQQQNDADKTEFETSFRDEANATQPQRVEITAVTVRAPAASAFADIIKTKALEVTTQTETAVSEVQYTVTAGKTFYLTYYGASSFTPLSVIVRVKKNGTTVLQRTSWHGAESGDLVFSIPLKFAVGGDVITVTVEAQTPKGNVWVGYAGYEV